MEYVKQLIVVFDVAARCHAMESELALIGAKAKVLPNRSSGVKAVLDNEYSQAEILILYAEPEHLVSTVASLRSATAVSGIVSVATLADPAQRAELLLSGADAYFPPHASAAELVAMLEALRRRSAGRSADQETEAPSPKKDTPKAAPWTVKDNGWTLISPKGVEVKLTYGEKHFIELLQSSPDRRVSREILMASKVGNSENSRAVDSLISRLRRKSVVAGAELPIKSVHGWGYSFAGHFAGEEPEPAVSALVQADPLTVQVDDRQHFVVVSEIQESYAHRSSTPPVALVMMFQAKVNATTGMQDGVEAQLHWRLRNGDMARLEGVHYDSLDMATLCWLYECCLQVLCNELKSWASEYELRIPITLKVPLAVLMQLYQPLIQRLLALGLNDGSLELALTNYDVDAENSAIQEMLSMLATLNVPVWLDNYTSRSDNLTYLELWKLHGVHLSFSKEKTFLPANQLKSLIMMTCKLCTSLGLKTVVTEVSSAADRTELYDVGADYLHGDFISLPLSRDGLLLAMASGQTS